MPALALASRRSAPRHVATEAARRIRRRYAVLAALAVVLPATLPLAAAGMADAAYPVPKPPATLPSDIEALAPYKGQTTCDPVAKPGVKAFRDLVLRTYPATGDSGISRACTSGGTSEHKEGRAWDWRVRATVPSEKAQADTLVTWLLATDSAGHPYAMARRAGIMYMIWNDRIWSSSRAGEGWRPYVHPACRSIPLAQCSSTYRHLDHVHISFSWPGAWKQTSFWTGKVADAGGSTPAPAPAPAPVPVPVPLPPVTSVTSLTPYLGSTLRQGARSTAVIALQKGLRLTLVDGVFGAGTKASVIAFQKAQGQAATGVVTPTTWQALDRDIRRGSLRIAGVDDVLLRPGARSSQAVPVLERALRRPADTTYDAGSVAAVRAFQRYHGLTVDGVVNWRTWQALRKL